MPNALDRAHPALKFGHKGVSKWKLAKERDATDRRRQP